MRELKGNKYDSNLSTKEIAKLIRNELKETGCKWSATFESFSGGSSICVSLMEASFDVLIEQETSHAINKYWLDKNLTEKGKEIFERANQIILSYRRDDSDSMIDYFDVNFYYDLQIGKWNKPFKKIEKK